MVPIDGVLNLGEIGPGEFASEMARSKMLVGIGQVLQRFPNKMKLKLKPQPWLAPSSYLALCLVSLPVFPVSMLINYEIENTLSQLAETLGSGRSG